jgi:hypothetical protein
MAQPVAFKLTDTPGLTVHTVSLDKAVASRLTARSAATAPAVLAVTNVALLEQISTGVFDDEDVQVVVQGDWSRALLIVVPAQVPPAAEAHAPAATGEDKSDTEFLAYVEREVPELSGLARELVLAIRNEGIEGDLQLEGHRWVNRPLNTFTLAVQTRVKNFQFTLYGGPEKFGKRDFIKSDQNGYSRGWVRSREDIGEFVELAAMAHKNKLRRAPLVLRTRSSRWPVGWPDPNTGE